MLPWRKHTNFLEFTLTKSSMYYIIVDMKSNKAKPKLTLGEILKGQSRFSGGRNISANLPKTKFVPKSVRITQHKGG